MCMTTTRPCHAHGRTGAGQLRLSLIDHSTLNNEYFNLLVFGANIGKKEQSSVGLGVSSQTCHLSRHCSDPRFEGIENEARSARSTLIYARVSYVVCTEGAVGNPCSDGFGTKGDACSGTGRDIGGTGARRAFPTMRHRSCRAYGSWRRWLGAMRLVL